MRLIPLLTLLALILVACNDGSDNGGTDDLVPALTHTFDPQMLDMAEETSDICQSWALNNEEPLYVRKIRQTNDGGWHHIVAVKDATHIRLYVDGEEKDAVAKSYAAGFDGDVPLNVGYLNLEGEMVIPPEFEDADDFCEVRRHGVARAHDIERLHVAEVRATRQRFLD